MAEVAVTVALGKLREKEGELYATLSIDTSKLQSFLKDNKHVKRLVKIE